MLETSDKKQALTDYTAVFGGGVGERQRIMIKEIIILYYTPLWLRQKVKALYLDDTSQRSYKADIITAT